ncbi:hypothetical protein YC2023_033759 [Brassica napus]
MTNVAIEVLDVKVEILVKLINANHVFMKEMFRGGATKLDVERMREKPRIHARKKTASVKGKAVTSLDEAKIISLVSGILKPEIERSMGNMVQNALSKHVLEKEAMTPPRVTTSKVPSGANITAGPVDANDEILKNVMANISDYSTPPDSVDRVQLSDGRTRSYRPQGIASPGMWNENNGGATYSATSQTNDRNKTEGIPSFDLGVTQDVRPPVAVQDAELGDTGDRQCEERVDDPQPCRKSKRLRLTLPILPKKLALCPGRCLLLRLVRSTFYNQVGSRGGKIPEFLDSRLVSLLARNYDRFRRSKSKESYVFAKGAKIYVLDCNSAVRSDSQLALDLLPISDMFPALLKSSGLLEIPGGIGLLSERIKGVAQNNNAADSALTAALLMQTHALFGPNTCRCITPDVLGDEAHRAAVMLYEFHEKLQ